MEAFSNDDTEHEVIDDVDGTATSATVLNQNLSYADETFAPQINTFTPSDVVLYCQNEQMFLHSEMFLNCFRSLSRCMEQLKKLTVKVVVTRTETAADNSRTETREAIYQGSGALLTRHFSRRIPEDFLAHNADILGSQMSYDDFKLYVQTTRHLINDDIDAIKSTVSIHNINGNGEDMLPIPGHHAHHAAIPGDRTVTLVCQGVTSEIVETFQCLKDDFFLSVQQITEEEKRRLVDKAIMVSYPNGRGPVVSVGDFKEVRYLGYRSRTGDMRFKRVNKAEVSQNQEKMWRGIIHNLPTCEGSNGAPIITFKYDGVVVVHEIWMHDGVALESPLKGTLLKLCTQEDMQRPITANRNPHTPESRGLNSLTDPRSVVSRLPARTAVHQVTPQACQRPRQSDSLMSCVQLRLTDISSSFQASSLLTSTMTLDRVPEDRSY